MGLAWVRPFMYLLTPYIKSKHDDRQQPDILSADFGTDAVPSANVDLKTARIAELNDRLRTTYVGGRIMVTSGGQALGRPAVHEIMIQLREFLDFNPDNDPYEDHDGGMFDHAGEQIMWKIDYYDLAVEYGSPDPSDPSVTTRVLTVFLAEEY
jgi:hypothetical protein